MYRDSGRKSLIPRTPIGVGRRLDDLPRPSFSMQRQRTADRCSVASNAFGRVSAAGPPRSSLAVGSLSGRPSTLIAPSASNRRCLQLPNIVPFKDPRPVSDRGRQSEMVQRIYGFLNSKDVPFAYTEKTIKMPASKNEFKQLFEFLFREVDEHYNVQKIDEEFPKIFASLGFPIQIKNSHMMTVSVPHTWPVLLAALDWLITEVIEVSERSEDESFVDDDMQLPYSYFTTCYIKKKLGSDPDYSPELERFRELMNENGNGRGVDESYRIHYNQRIENETELKGLQAECNAEKELISIAEAYLRDYDYDLNVLNKYIQECRALASLNENEKKEQEIYLQKMADSLAEILKQIAQKESLIASQKLSGDEVRAIYSKSKKLKSNLSTTREELKETEAKIDELQPRVYKQMNSIHSEYKKFLTNLQDLCEKFLSQEEFDAIDWSHYDYDQVWAEYSRASKCALSDLIGKLKNGMEETMKRYRDEEQQSVDAIETRNKEIFEIETAKLKEEREHNLKMERMKRQVANSAEQIQRAEVERGLVEGTHCRAKTEFNTLRTRCMEANERLANMEQLYTTQRIDLERTYNEILAMATEKIMQSHLKIERIQSVKVRWMNLGKEVLESNRKTLEELRQKRRSSMGVNLTNISMQNA